jgi:hypothetical protein
MNPLPTEPEERRNAMQPVRKITNGGGKNIGKYPSEKVGRAIDFESLLESDCIENLEGDQDVLLYCEQPETIEYDMKGKKLHYTPDFRVIRRSGKPQNIEVKPKAKTKTAKFKAMIRQVAPIFQKRGEEFIVLTEKTIRMQPRLDNLKILRRYSRESISIVEHIELNAILAKRGKATVAELSSALAQRGITVQKIYALIYRGFLTVDLDKELCPKSVITLKGGCK